MGDNLIIKINSENESVIRKMEDLISDKLEDSNQNQLFFIYIAPMNLSDFMKNLCNIEFERHITFCLFCIIEFALERRLRENR